MKDHDQEWHVKNKDPEWHAKRLELDELYRDYNLNQQLISEQEERIERLKAFLGVEI